MSMTTRRIATLAVLMACVAGTAHIAARPATQPQPTPPSAAAIADSQAVAATHRSRTLAALFEEFRTTTPQNARINSRAISNLFFDGNPLMRPDPVRSDAIEPREVAGPAGLERRDGVGLEPGEGSARFLDWREIPTAHKCEAVALNNGALLAGTDMDPKVCQTCHQSFPTDTTALVGSLNHCDVVRR
jgi:hypothetical protein